MSINMAFQVVSDTRLKDVKESYIRLKLHISSSLSTKTENAGAQMDITKLLRGSFGKFYEKLCMDTIHEKFINFAEGAKVAQEFSTVIQFLEKSLQKNFRLKRFPYIPLTGKIVLIGSCKDESKAHSINEIDSLYVFTTEDVEVNKSSPYFIRIKGNNITASEVVETFADALEKSIKEIRLEEFAILKRHGGFMSPEFSGIRFSGPACTGLLQTSTSVCITQPATVSLDVTVAATLPRDSADYLTIMDTKEGIISIVRQQNPQKNMVQNADLHLIPDPVKNEWVLSTAALEAELMQQMPTYAPAKDAFRIAKYITHSVADCNSDQEILHLIKPLPDVSGFNSIQHIRQCVLQVVEAAGSRGLAQESSRIMRYGHTFLSHKEADDYHELAKAVVSINSASVKHLVLQKAMEHPLAFADKENEDLAYDLVSNTFQCIASGDHTHVANVFLPTAIKINTLSVSVFGAITWPIAELRPLIQAECGMLVDKLLPQEGKAAQMSSYVVPLTSLESPDYTFSVSTNFSLSVKVNPHLHYVRQILAAMLNTCGGVIQIENHGTCTPNIDGWIGRLRSFLQVVVPKLDQCVQISQYGNGVSLLVKNRDSVATPIVLEAGQCLPRDLSDDINTVHPAYIQGKITKEGLIKQESKGHTQPLEGEEHDVAIVAPASSHSDEHLLQDSEIKSQGLPTTILKRLGPDDDPEVLDEATKYKSMLSWTSDTQDWMQGLVIGTDKSSNLIRNCDLLKATQPMNVTRINDLPSEYHSSKLYDCLENHFSTSTGFAIMTKCWLSQLDVRMEHLPRPSTQILDVMECVQGKNSIALRLLILLAKLKPALMTHDERAYGFESARLTTFLLHRWLTSKGKGGGGIHVRCQWLYVDNGDDHITDFMKQHTEKFFLVDSPMEILQHGLGVLLLQKSTKLRTKLDDSILIRLTYEQSRAILECQRQHQQPIVYIVGPPGSGKTIVSFHLSENFEREKTVFACTTTAYMKYIIFQGKPITCLLGTKHDLIELKTSNILHGKSCFIIDDAHNIASMDNDSWDDLLCYLFEFPDLKVYIVADSEHQNYKAHDCNIMDCYYKFCRENGMDPCLVILSQNHRNSQKVAAFVNSNRPRRRGVTPAMECLHAQIGDDVEVRRVRNLRSWGLDNGLLQFIRMLTDDERLYLLEHIVVLSDNKDDIDLLRAILSTRLPGGAHGAGKFPRTGLTIDHVDQFMGLEAHVVVFLCGPQAWHSSPEQTIYHMENAKYRTFLASRGVFRVAFLCESQLDHRAVLTMGFDGVSHPDSDSHHPQDYSRLVPVATIETPSPYGIAATKRGTVLVTELDHHQVTEYDLSGKVVHQWGSRGQEAGQFEYPSGVTVSSDGTTYVTSNHTVQVFDPQGNVIRSFGTQGDGQLAYPCGIALDEASQMAYIADRGNSRVAIYRMTGQYQGSFTSEDLQNPRDISLYQGHVYVTDRVQHHIAVFDLQGNMVRVIGRKGRGPGEFDRPWGITIDSDGTVILCDRHNDRLQFLSTTGEVLHVMGSYGTDLGQFRSPGAATLTANRYLIVAEIDGQRLQVFK